MSPQNIYESLKTDFDASLRTSKLEWMITAHTVNSPTSAPKFNNLKLHTELTQNIKGHCVTIKEIILAGKGKSISIFFFSINDFNLGFCNTAYMLAGGGFSLFPIRGENGRVCWNDSDAANVQIMWPAFASNWHFTPEYNGHHWH